MKKKPSRPSPRPRPAPPTNCRRRRSEHRRPPPETMPPSGDHRGPATTGSDEHWGPATTGVRRPQGPATTGVRRPPGPAICWVRRTGDSAVRPPAPTTGSGAITLEPVKRQRFSQESSAGSRKPTLRHPLPGVALRAFHRCARAVPRLIGSRLWNGIIPVGGRRGHSRRCAGRFAVLRTSPRLQHALGRGAAAPEVASVRHRPAAGRLVEVFGSKVEAADAEHLAPHSIPSTPASGDDKLPKRLLPFGSGGSGCRGGGRRGRLRVSTIGTMVRPGWRCGAAGTARFGGAGAVLSSLRIAPGS